MGFIDAFKRWRLANKGMSSGKKRRTTTTSENAMVDSMERSVWMKLIIYPAFTALACLIAAFYVSDQTLFHDDVTRRMLMSLIVAVAVILLYHIRHSLKAGNGQVVLIFGGILVHLVLLRTTCYLIDQNDWDADFKLLMVPMAFAPMVHSVLAGRHAGVFSAVSVSLFGCLLMPIEDVFTYIVMSLIAGCVAVALTRKVRRRGNLLRAGFYVGLTTFLLALAFNKIDLSLLASSEGISDEGRKIVVVLLGGLLTGMVVSGLLPALESLFTITTNISWLELSDLNHKLLRKLQLETPGTYHHSMVVATLAESAAEDIGANASMCRVCSYFHDIGKLNKPEYFIENQGDHNPHDTLTPTMSAIIIIAHVKDGVDMAIKHKLNPKIIEVIREHHGDSIVQYFYHKAREQRLESEKKVDEGLENREDVSKVDMRSFRYPGPCPSSRESGIISIADCVESASRTLKKPTPQKIRNLVDEIVMARVTSGQLDDSGLTMGEIKKVSDSFASTLRSMMHSRIDYPKDDESSLGLGQQQRKSKANKPSATEALVSSSTKSSEHSGEKSEGKP